MVISTAKKQYLNMTATGKWDKLDPQNAKIIALLKTIKYNMQSQSQGYDPSKNTVDGGHSDYGYGGGGGTSGG